MFYRQNEQKHEEPQNKFCKKNEIFIPKTIQLRKNFTYGRENMNMNPSVVCIYVQMYKVG